VFFCFKSGGELVIRGRIKNTLRGFKMKREFNVIIEQDSEGYFVATVPELRGCHTQAKSLDTLMKRVREAIELCLEVEGEESRVTRFVGVQRVEV
jgi:predicted RNase H-like HicB family nuclease